jgi:hypothetical protein
MLLLPEWQTDEAWELSKRSGLTEIGKHQLGAYRQSSDRLTADILGFRSELSVPWLRVRGELL